MVLKHFNRISQLLIRCRNLRYVTGSVTVPLVVVITPVEQVVFGDQTRSSMEVSPKFDMDDG
jgi:hypothetical protein